MQNKNQAQHLNERWDAAVERAQQEQARATELDAELLNDAAGLHVRAGVRAGGWTHSCSCDNTCTCNAICSA